MGENTTKVGGNYYDNSYSIPNGKTCTSCSGNGYKGLGPCSCDNGKISNTTRTDCPNCDGGTIPTYGPHSGEVRFSPSGLTDWYAAICDRCGNKNSSSSWGEAFLNKTVTWGTCTKNPTGSRDCPNCDDGWITNTTTSDCTQCGGDGTISAGDPGATKCTTCGGDGKVTKHVTDTGYTAQYTYINNIKISISGYYQGWTITADCRYAFRASDRGVCRISKFEKEYSGLNLLEYTSSGITFGTDRPNYVYLEIYAQCKSGFENVFANNGYYYITETYDYHNNQDNGS